MRQMFNNGKPAKRQHDAVWSVVSSDASPLFRALYDNSDNTSLSKTRMISASSMQKGVQTEVPPICTKSKTLVVSETSVKKWWSRRSL